MTAQDKPNADKQSSDEQATDDRAPPGESGPGQRRPRSRLERLRTGFVVLLVLSISWATFLAVVLAVALMYGFDERKSDLVESVVPAGRVITLRLHSGLMTRAVVETDLGFYALTSGVSLGKNEALTLELRAGAERFLCDAQHRCTRLL